MDDDAPIRWWRVASHLIRPAWILTAAGSPPSAALGAWLVWGDPGLALGALAVLVLIVTGAATFVGLALLLVAGLSVAIGRVQWAIYARRSRRRHRSVAPRTPYR